MHDNLKDIIMKRLFEIRSVLGLAAVAASLALAGNSWAAVDEDAAKALFKKNDCTKCHSTTKDKKGPSLQKIAGKYKGKADGEEKVTKNMTTSPKVKMDDGTEEEHKMLNTKDAGAIKNLAQWILSH